MKRFLEDRWTTFAQETNNETKEKNNETKETNNETKQKNDETKDETKIEEESNFETSFLKQVIEVWEVLKDFLKDEWVLFLVGILGVVQSAVLTSMVPRCFGRILDAFGKGMDAIKGPALETIVVVLLQLLVNFNTQNAIATATERIGVRIKGQLFASLLRKDMEYFDFTSTGSSLAQMTMDVENVYHSLKHFVTNGMRSAGQAISGVVSLFLISPKLTAVLGVTFPTMVFLGRYAAKKLQVVSLLAHQAQVDATSIARESLTNIQTVRSCVAEEVQEQAFEKKLATHHRLTRLFQIGVGLFHSISMLSMQCISFGMLLYGASMVQSGLLSVGDISSFMLSASALQGSLSSLSMLHSEVSEGLASLFRIKSVIEGPVLIENGKGRVLDHLSTISFRNVSFSYPTRPQLPVLSKVNLELKEGKFYAFVGPSGSGKTTITKLLQRFYDPSEGEILIGSDPLSSIEPRSLRRFMAVVQQEPLIFNMSLADNIRYGKPDATFEEIQSAAKRANIHDFIISLPDGYDSLPGEGGKRLSTGQKQRLSIARAILRDAKLIIFDEATASLDSVSEHHIQKAVSNLLHEGRTLIVIAHRLSTIRAADEILVLQHGHLVEQGSHSELASKNGVYHHLLTSQHDKNQI